MKLEIKYLAPYLPYGLKLFDPNPEVNGGFTELDEDNLGEYLFYPLSIPILRPLSDLTKEIEHKGVKIIPIDFFEIGNGYNDIVDYGQGNVKLIGLLKDIAEHNFIHPCYMNYGVIIKLFEWHFDVFGLIEKGLAIDINELKH